MGLQQRITELLPEIDDVQDNALRERVVAAWMAAAKHGGWTEEDLEEIPLTLLIEGVSVSLFTHIRAVTRTAVAIADILEDTYGDLLDINRDHLIMAGLLHDVGKLLEYERTAEGKIQKSRSGRLLRHPISGAVLAGELGVPEEVLHIIAGHSKEGDFSPRTVEGVIIHHADFVHFESFKALK